MSAANALWFLLAAVVMAIVVVGARRQLVRDASKPEPCGCPRASKRRLSYIPPQNGRNSQ